MAATCLDFLLLFANQINFISFGHCNNIGLRKLPQVFPIPMKHQVHSVQIVAVYADHSTCRPQKILTEKVLKKDLCVREIPHFLYPYAERSERTPCQHKWSTLMLLKVQQRRKKKTKRN